MEETPKLRKSLTLSSRLRNRSRAASPGARLRKTQLASSSSPIQVDRGVACTPPHRSNTYNPLYSPSNELDFSPRSTLSQSSINSPDVVTWRWNDCEDENPSHKSKLSPALAKSKPSSCTSREFRKKRSVEEKEVFRKAEIEKRKAIRTKRDIDLKKQLEQAEQLISKNRNSMQSPEKEKSPVRTQARELSSSSGYGSNSNIENALDLLNDSETDGMLLVATQQVETTIGKTKTNCQKNHEQTFLENEAKEKFAMYDFLHDSCDDWFTAVDTELLSAQAKKPRTSLQRYKSMPTESPKTSEKVETSTIKRYPSSSTLPEQSRTRQKLHVFQLMEKNCIQIKERVRRGDIPYFGSGINLSIKKQNERTTKTCR